jgi:hypothetical protein
MKLHDIDCDNCGKLLGDEFCDSYNTPLHVATRHAGIKLTLPDGGCLDFCDYACMGAYDNARLAPIVDQFRCGFERMPDE